MHCHLETLRVARSLSPKHYKRARDAGRVKLLRSLVYRTACHANLDLVRGVRIEQDVDEPHGATISDSGRPISCQSSAPHLAGASHGPRHRTSEEAQRRPRASPAPGLTRRRTSRRRPGRCGGAVPSRGMSGELGRSPGRTDDFHDPRLDPTDEDGLRCRLDHLVEVDGSEQLVLRRRALLGHRRWPRPDL